MSDDEKNKIVEFLNYRVMHLKYIDMDFKNNLEFNLLDNKIKKFFEIAIEENNNTLHEVMVLRTVIALGLFQCPVRCIGIKDKNNTDIKTGDILITEKQYDPFVTQSKYVISYDNNIETYTVNKKNTHVEKMIFTRIELSTLDLEKLTIIGNVFSNPEIIEIYGSVSV